MPRDQQQPRQSAEFFGHPLLKTFRPSASAALASPAPHPCASIAATASITGWHMITMPGPPPKGRSSTFLWGSLRVIPQLVQMVGNQSLVLRPLQDAAAQHPGKHLRKKRQDIKSHRASGRGVRLGGGRSDGPGIHGPLQELPDGVGRLGAGFDPVVHAGLIHEDLLGDLSWLTGS